MVHPCPNKVCPNYGRQCYRCCNHCGNPVLWRPPLLDKEIAYKGPKPLEPDGRTVHRCMRGGTKDHQFYHTESAGRNQQKSDPPSSPPWPLPLPPGIHLGISHLWYEGEFVRLYKCPLCSFQNIHKDVINHHIKFAYDKYHNQSGVII